MTNDICRQESNASKLSVTLFPPEDSEFLPVLLKINSKNNKAAAPCT